MKKITLLPFVLIITFSACSQTEQIKNYYDKNNFLMMNKITVREFVEELRVPDDKQENQISRFHIISINGRQDSTWINKEDVEYLMTLIDSKEQANCIMSIVSSYFPSEKTTLGDQVFFLIKAYREKLEFPYRLTFCGEFEESERNEILEWWETEKK